MRIDITNNCPTKSSCETYSPIPVEVTKSVVVDKTNTLHQFDAAGIIGIPSPVGKVPLVFYIKEAEGRGRRGIIYYDDYDSICYMYPESEHAGWCEQPYDLKYDKLEAWDNGTERGWRRNHGIFEIWVSVWREWYNGQIMYRPKLKIQGCGHEDDGYPMKSTVVTVEEKRPVHHVKQVNKRKINRGGGCGCRKGA